MSIITLATKNSVYMDDVKHITDTYCPDIEFKFKLMEDELDYPEPDHIGVVDNTGQIAHHYSGKSGKIVLVQRSVLAIDALYGTAVNILPEVDQDKTVSQKVLQMLGDKSDRSAMLITAVSVAHGWRSWHSIAHRDGSILRKDYYPNADGVEGIFVPVGSTVPQAGLPGQDRWKPQYSATSKAIISLFKNNIIS